MRMGLILPIWNFQNSTRPLKYRLSTPTSGETPGEEKFSLHQKLRLEISGGSLGVKPAIQAHLGVENPEKHTFEQNCPKSDATVKVKTMFKLKCSKTISSMN